MGFGCEKNNEWHSKRRICIDRIDKRKIRDIVITFIKTYKLAANTKTKIVPSSEAAILTCLKAYRSE